MVRIGRWLRRRLWSIGSIVSKEMKALRRAAERAGWRVALTKRGHYKWFPPEGRMVVTASTPSDHRALSNIKSMLRKEGLVL